MGRAGTNDFPEGYKPWSERTVEERCGQTVPIMIPRALWEKANALGWDLRAYAISQKIPRNRP